MIAAVGASSRREFLRRAGIASGAVLAAGGLATAAAAAVPPEEDLAWIRLGATVELLSIDFYRRSLSTRRLTSADRALLRAARAADARHYRALTAALAAGGGVPVEPADLEFAYPARALSGRAGIATTAAAIERIALGASLGALAALTDAGLRAAVAPVAAEDAAHLGAALGLLRPPGLGAFPAPLSLEAASTALGRFVAA
jgi:hypothetical protein